VRYNQIFSKILKPDIVIPRISEIDVNLLKKWGIKGLILDVDNTIIARKSDKIDQDIINWFKNTKRYFKMIILSNNSRSKILRAAKPLNILYIPWTLKPLSIYYQVAFMKMNLSPKEVCAIGDQIFTDILGAKLFHMKTIYIIPLNSNDDSDWTKFVRLFERLLFKKWIKKAFRI